MIQDTAHAFKGVLDMASVGTIFAVMIGYMPHIASVLTVLWLGFRCYNEVMTAVYRRRGHRQGLGNGAND